MRFRLDHIVIAVGDLARAVEEYRSRGFTVEIGGRHPTRTSHNALIAFEDGAYIELIAWHAPMPSDRWWNTHVAHGDGLMDFALLPEDTKRAIDEAKPRGLALDGPLDGGRMRPDGKELKWQTARPATFDLPFLCGDLTPREWRVPQGGAQRHANGATGVETVEVAVHDVRKTLERYGALLGKTVAAAPIVLGSTTIAFDESQPRLANRGEGPYRVTLRAAAGNSPIVLA